MSNISIRSLVSSDKEWVAQFLGQSWGSNVIISRGVAHVADELPGFVAIEQGEHVGLLTYHIQGDECEVVSINSMRPYAGVGTELIEAIKEAAGRGGCRRVWLITTNDNLDALRFYQRRGFVLVAVHRNALAQSRKLKPQIPLIGKYGIPLRDEIELELLLDNGQGSMAEKGNKGNELSDRTDAPI